MKPRVHACDANQHWLKKHYSVPWIQKASKPPWMPLARSPPSGWWCTGRSRTSEMKPSPPLQKKGSSSLRCGRKRLKGNGSIRRRARHELRDYFGVSSRCRRVSGERAMTFRATTRRKLFCDVRASRAGTTSEKRISRAPFLSHGGLRLVEFSMNMEPATMKKCSVCQRRTGVYVVVYWTKEDRTWDNKVRYCWLCLPAEQRHYLRVNY